MEPADALVEAVRRFGPALAVDPSRTRGLLADYGVERRWTSALVAAIESGVASEAAVVRVGEPDESRFDRLARQLHEQMATDQTMARWAVEAWSTALAPGAGQTTGDVVAPDQGSRPDGSVPHDDWVVPWDKTGDQTAPEAGGTPGPDDTLVDNPEPDGEPARDEVDETVEAEWSEQHRATKPIHDHLGGPAEPEPEPESRRQPEPEPKRRVGLITALVAVAVLAAAGGVVAAIKLTAKKVSCTPTTTELCVVGQANATVDAKPARSDRALKPRQTVSATSSSPAVHVRLQGSDVYLDGGARLEIGSGDSATLRAGRAWVVAGSNGPAHLSAASPTATEVSVDGSALLDVRDGTKVVVRTGQAILNGGTQVSALKRADAPSGSSTFTVGVYTPDSIPGPDSWLDKLPVDPGAGGSPNAALAASITGTWTWQRTVTYTDDHHTHEGDATYRQVDLKTTCTGNTCGLTASTAGATAPVTFDGSIYHATLRPQGYCAGTPTVPFTLEFAFKPTAPTNATTARPSATAISGAWTERFDASGGCIGSNTIYDATAKPGNGDPSAFPTRDEETALQNAFVPWNRCQRADKPANAVAAVTCAGTPPIASIAVTVYRDSASATAAYNARVANSGVAPNSANANGVKEGGFSNLSGRFLDDVNPAGKAEILTVTPGSKLLVDWIGTSGDLTALNAARTAQLA